MSVAIPESPASPAGSAPTRRWNPPAVSRRVAGGALLIAFGLVVGAVSPRILNSSTNTAASSSPPPEKKAESNEGEVTLSAEQQTTYGIEIGVAKVAPLVSRTWRTGRVVLHEDRIAHICPPAEGVVREVPAQLGQNVKAGDILAVLESREFGQAKLEALKAKIALAAEREQVARTRMTMTNAEELLRLLAAETPLAEIERKLTDKPIGDWRQQILGAYTRRTQLNALVASQQSSLGAVSEATLRKTRSEAEAASATYTALVEELRFQVKQQVRQAELKLKEAETASDVARATLLFYGLTPESIDDLDPIKEGAEATRLPVKAPFAGTVVEKHAVRSERVGPQTQLFLLADLSRLRIQVDVYEADLALVRGLMGKPVMVRSTVAGIPERPATVTYPGDLINRNSRSLTLTAEADNTDRLLKPGLFVEVGFETGDPTPVLQVPTTAVLLNENRPFVFVQRESGSDRFQQCAIRLGRTVGENVEVKSGIKEGDRVVIQGGFVLKSELLKDQMVGE